MKRVVFFAVLVLFIIIEPLTVNAVEGEKDSQANILMVSGK